MNGTLNTGFTLLEVLAVLAITGILAAIAAPSWLSFIESQEVKAVNEKAFQAIREAQSKSIQNRLSKTIEFRAFNGEIQYTIYDTRSPSFSWQTIGEAELHSETDFTTLNFDFQGNVEFPLITDSFPTIAFSKNDRYLTCVQVRTLLGALSMETDDRCIP